jgi:hypothetical protein
MNRRFVRIIRSTGNIAVTSQYSVWLLGGRPVDLGLIPGRGERIFPLASVSRPALGPTQPPVQWVSCKLDLKFFLRPRIQKLGNCANL